jgi:hypothetical protein
MRGNAFADIALCQHPESSADFEEYQLILVIPLFDSEELPLSVLSRDSLPARRERTCPAQLHKWKHYCKKGYGVGRFCRKFDGVLNAGELGVTDNFFDYGYSLLTIEDGRQR